ncbi:MAG TPA: hypothetical protein VKN18_06385 [Blastocatellia bacterium]|nr:hypothetical protein [Blastocatellia bacterium]
MKGHQLPRGRTWILLLIAVVLFGAHGVILYYVSSHLTLSAAVVSVVIILVVIKHLRLLSSLRGLSRRRPRP